MLRRPVALRALLAAFAVLTVLVLGPVPAAQAAHPFYTNLLREGAVDLDRQNWLEAAEALQVASFGLLEEPSRLAEALTGLAVAQAGLDDEDAFNDTLTRLVDLEERFGAYTSAELLPQVRRRFEAAALAHGSDVLLAAVPAFEPLLARRDPEGARRRAAAREPAGDSGTQTAEAEPPRKPTRRERKAAREAAREAAEQERPEQARAEPPTAPVVTDVQVVDETVAPAPAALTADERAVLDRGQAVLSSASDAGELSRALDSVRGVADAHPGHQASQILAGEIAYRASRFEDAAHFFDRVGPDGSDRPDLAFYMAVTWYETGQPERAVEVLQPSLPRLQRTPFVESWIEKIFGPDAPSAREG